MFGLLKRKNPYEQAARDLYLCVMAQSRAPVFYEDFGVPDTFDGRFDVLSLHLFMVMEALRAHGAAGADLSQALFDVCFADMDQTLREMGIGDMGIPKHMRKMMTAFNGRMHAYQTGLEQGDLRAALARNVYGDAGDAAHPDALERYVRHTLGGLTALGFAAFEAGEVVFDKGGKDGT
ncbi:MAG: ubiquinol-cytochrome C chaperone family protein [Bdellovibrionales bacterium]